MLTKTAKRLLVKILAIYSAYLCVRFHICILIIKLKTTDLSGYYAYTVNCMFPFSSSKFQPCSLCRECVWPCHVASLVSGTMTRTERFLGWASGWMGEHATVTFVEFQLSDSAHRQSLENRITSPEENVGVISLDNGRAVLRQEKSQWGVSLFFFRSSGWIELCYMCNSCL